MLFQIIHAQLQKYVGLCEFSVSDINPKVEDIRHSVHHAFETYLQKRKDIFFLNFIPAKLPFLKAQTIKAKKTCIETLQSAMKKIPSQRRITIHYMVTGSISVKKGMITIESSLVLFKKNKILKKVKVSGRTDKLISIQKIITKKLFEDFYLYNHFM